MKVVKGEMATRTSFQRSAKGNVSIAECHPEGKYIVLENTHRSKDEILDDWKLKRNVDGKLDLEYQFPPRTTIKAGKTIRIWARNQGGINNPPDNIIFDAADSWGSGSNVQTSLLNKEGEERATHVQRTSQQSTATI
uniref:LTD domain-containing protein n=1 Tax=Romanomermis culicivorax TaxID=13658 RepID=A0A915K398_ROMCU